MSSDIGKKLAARISRSTQPTAEGRRLADHLAGCILADATLGVVEVRPATSDGRAVWRTPVSTITITPTGDGAWSPAIAIARGTITIEQAERIAADLLAAAAAARQCRGRGGALGGLFEAVTA